MKIEASTYFAFVILPSLPARSKAKSLIDLCILTGMLYSVYSRFNLNWLNVILLKFFVNMFSTLKLGFHLRLIEFQSKRMTLKHVQLAKIHKQHQPMSMTVFSKDSLPYSFRRIKSKIDNFWNGSSESTGFFYTNLQNACKLKEFSYLLCFGENLARFKRYFDFCFYDKSIFVSLWWTITYCIQLLTV